MNRCQPPMVQPVVTSAAHRPKDSLANHFFRWLRWSAVAAAMIPICIVVVVQWQSVRQAEIEARLKQDMLDRGMSVQEIERVLRASPNPARDRSYSAEQNYYTARHAEIEAQLIKDLAGMNMPAEDVEQIYKAFTALSGTGARNYHTSERAAKDAAFVRKLAQNGRKAEEIERLLKVAGKKQEPAEKVAEASEKSQQAKVEDALKVLLRSGLTAEDLNRILAQEDRAEARPTP